MIAMAGRHIILHSFYLKGDLVHKSSICQDVGLKTTDIDSLESPRDFSQIDKIVQQLGREKSVSLR